jgi:hypothetical protein
MDQSLYDKAGLVLFPSGYKDGKLYNIKPFDKSFNFSRGADLWATRVNADGLIEPMIELGEDLIINGTFDTDTTEWTPNSSATLTIDNQRLKVSISGSASGYPSQTIITEVGKQYKITASVLIGTASKVSLWNNANSIFNDLSTDGSYSFYFTATSTSTAIRLYVYGDGTYAFWDNVSVKEVLPLENTPRIDYSDGTPSLLLEPARTNLITYSEDIANYTMININPTNNDNISPDGYQNATKLETTNTGQCHMRRSFTASSTGNYIGSVFLKKQDFNYIYTELGGAYAWFNIGNGTIGNSGNYGSDWAYVNHSIEYYGNGWYRCVIIGNCLNTGTYPYRPVQMVSANGSYNSNLTGGVTYSFGVQVEQGSYPTSYIPTYGTIATRSADVCVGAGDASTFNDSEGVLFANVAALANDTVYRAFSLRGANANDRVVLSFMNTGLHQLRSFVVSGGSANFLPDHTLSNSVIFNKIALKYKVNDFALWVNGAEAKTDTSGNAPTGLKSFEFNNGASSDIFYGRIKQLIVFNEALTDEQLQALTT